jgi:iron complex transport system substrate-binding protein
MKALLRLVAVLSALALAVGLAACGDDDSSDSSSGSGTNASSASAFPVTVEHKFGKTTIEKEPKRVVTVGYTDQDAILAVGVVPVGVGDFGGGYKWRERPWAQDLLKGAKPKVVSTTEINFEAVASLRPDLIIGINAGLKQDQYDKLSKIAPTIGQSGEYVDFGMPWDEQQMLVAKALGREEQGQKLVDETKAKFEAVRKEHPEFEGKTSILGYGGPDGYGAYATQDTRSRFLTDLGFKIPAEIDKLAGKSFYAQFSQENFRLLDQDFLLMYGPQDNIEKNKIMARTNAVKEGRVVYLDLPDQMAGALGFASAPSLNWVLDNEIDAIAAAVDGNPATKVEQPE